MPILFLITLLSPSLVTSASNMSLQADGVEAGVDWDKDCISPLSEVSPDGNITLTDYANYVSILSDQRIPPNQDLPLSLTETFNHLACLQCENVFEDESDGRCCIWHDETAFIINLGDVKNPKTSKDNLYIFFVCSDTKARVDDLFAPSGAPSPIPSLSQEPTSAPSFPPSTKSGKITKSIKSSKSVKIAKSSKKSDKTVGSCPCSGRVRQGITYQDHCWNELPKDAKNAAKVLGYNENEWNNEDYLGSPPTRRNVWFALTDEERAAALFLGWRMAIWWENPIYHECDLE